jgi:hypothetical protein
VQRFLHGRRGIAERHLGEARPSVAICRADPTGGTSTDAINPPSHHSPTLSWAQITTSGPCPASAATGKLVVMSWGVSMRTLIPNSVSKPLAISFEPCTRALPSRLRAHHWSRQPRAGEPGKPHPQPGASISREFRQYGLISCDHRPTLKFIAIRC